jgi:hypothetical protein
MRTLIYSALITFLYLSGHALAAPPSHCTASEYSIVNAWMGEVHATDGGWRNSRNGKFLSLCADSQSEPFTTVTYRYGVLGQVEFEAVATPRNKFEIASIVATPHSGDDVVFFQKGDYTYYVAIATGMGSGVSLYVFKGAKKIASHFSGNGGAGEDYQLGPAEIDFVSNRSLSPVLIPGKPRHALD